MERDIVRVWKDRIRDVLNQEWDPIGGCPPDEYDVYADKLTRMIVDHATDDELVRYLEWAVSVNMGFGHSDREHASSVVSSIRAALGRTH